MAGKGKPKQGCLAVATAIAVRTDTVEKLLLPHLTFLQHHTVHRLLIYLVDFKLGLLRVHLSV